MVAQPLGIGVLGGMVGGLVGVGGGIVCVPLLVAARLCTQHQAHGTSLVLVLSTAVVGTLTYADHVHASEALYISVPALLAAAGGASLTTVLPSQLLKRIFGFCLVVISAALPTLHDFKEAAKKRTQGSCPSQHADEGKEQPENGLSNTELVGLGSFAGFMSGLLGIGGGVMVTPALAIFATELPHHDVLGTSLASMILPAAFGALTHYRFGQVRAFLAVPLVIGASVGSYVGSKIALASDQEHLRILLSCVLGLSGLRMFLTR